jgi:hypothetical protein
LVGYVECVVVFGVCFVEILDMYLETFAREGVDLVLFDDLFGYGQRYSKNISDFLE